MIPISDTPPPGVIDRRDGSTKGECGITTVGCLFCKDQISASKTFVENYDEIEWAPRNGCHIATCPSWGNSTCYLEEGDNQKDPEKCPIYQRWKKSGRWKE